MGARNGAAAARREDTAETTTLEGTVQKVNFGSADTGWRVLTVLVGGQSIRVVGEMPVVDVGQKFKASGQHVDDPKWGPQFRATSVIPELPSTTDGLAKYIGSKFVKGLGPQLAERIVKHFGAGASDALLDPLTLTGVKGVSAELAQRIAEKWREKQAIAAVMAFLCDHGASPNLAGRIFAAYGPGAVDVLRNTPYRLSVDVDGIGFAIADRIAQSMGIARGSDERAAAATLHVLSESAEKGGHTWVERRNLIRLSLELLETDDPGSVGRAIDQLAQEKKLTLRTFTADDGHDLEAVFPARLFAAEQNVAARLQDLLETAVPEGKGDLGGLADRVIAKFESDMKFKLAPQQREAVEAVAQHKVLVITGPPGVGKTTILRAVLSLLLAAKLTVKLAAPTGRAAKRMSEATGAEAFTIHRLLEYRPPMGFTRKADNPLEADVVCVDESSMIDARLADSLLKAVPNGARFIFIGDVDQLPSVGPGAVLRDVIDSGRVPTVRLTQIFRQAEGSGISLAAQAINAGKMPQPKVGEFEVVMAEDPLHAARLVVHLVASIIPARMHCDPINDIQVISPMRKTEAGTTALNKRLQEVLNPDGARVRGDLRIGDKVIQARNNYDLDIYNGDIGVVVGVSEEDVLVNFDGREVLVPEDDVHDLHLAYASTVHRMQGGQQKIVVMTLLRAHYMMLQRPLLYTGITRAQKFVVLVTDDSALKTALRQHGRSRCTALARHLRGEV